MSDFKNNAFRIKRQAHASSRSDARFNPFYRLFVYNDRRQCWDGEAQRHHYLEDDDLEAGSPIEHSQTAPPTGANEPPDNGTDRRTSTDSSDEERPSSSGNAVIAPQAPVSGVVDHDRRHLRNRLSPEKELDDIRKTLRSRVRPGKKTVDSPDSGPADEPKKKKEHRMFKNVQPKEPFTVANQIRRVFCGSWLSLLLLCVPAGISLGAVIGPSLETFFVNFAAVIPLYWLGDFSMTEIGLRTGVLTSNIIGISMSNLVQLVSCIVLLVQGRISILKTTLIGGILANILLLLGLAMLFGAMRRQEQFFNRTSSHTSTVLLSLASTSVLIPTASLLMGQTTDSRINKQSRGAAVMLIIVYCLYLFFCLHTHREVFAETVQKVPLKPSASAQLQASIQRGFVSPGGLVGIPGEGNNSRLQQMLNSSPDDDEDDEEDDEPELSFWVALFTFLATTVLLYFCVDYVVNSIDALTSGTELSLTFVGLILLPILNCDFTPIISAVQDDMSATMDYTVGRSIQTALLVTPFTVLLAWWLGIDGVTLVFDGFEVVSLFATVLLLNLIISEGKNNWVMGVLLLADWALVAIAAFFVD